MTFNHLRMGLAAAMLTLGMSAQALEVAKVDDDALSCAQISAEVKEMQAIIAAGGEDVMAAKLRKERLEALAKATKCKLK